MKPGKIVSVIDIGSTQVICCIASILDNGQFNVVGAGSCVCYGVRAGEIINVDLVARSIAKAVEIAENSVNLRIKSVYVNVSGACVQSKIMSLGLRIGGRLVRQQDVMDILSACRDKNPEMETIHAVPIMFKLDDLCDISEPVGMFANLLKADVNVVSVLKSQINNIMACLIKCHLDVLGFIYSGYASGLCMLDETLAEENQIVLDLGGGVSSINFFYKGIFCGTENVALGGKNITRDISYGLNVSKTNAERLKTLYGAAFVSYNDNKDIIMAPIVDEDGIVSLQQLTKSSLNQIIQPRVEEILTLIKNKIDKSIFRNNFSRNMIITGGGSMLLGMREFMSEFFKMDVKTRKIEDYLANSGIQINNEFATALGMIRFAMVSDDTIFLKKNDSKARHSMNFFKKTINWLENNL